MKIYQAIARKIQAARNCHKLGNGDWFTRHCEAIEHIMREHAPSGSGFDSGTQLDILDHIDAGKDRLFFTTAFHHMNENGYYDGWTEHSVTVTPSLADGFNLKISGRDRNDIKAFIEEIFDNFLSADYQESN